MLHIYFPDFRFFHINDLPLLKDHNIICDLSFNSLITVAIIRPPEILSDIHFSCFPSLQYVLSDTTGVSHLSLSHKYPSLKVLTLRDVTPSQRESLTAASDLAFLLLQLSLRPVLRASFDYLSQLGDKSDSSLLRSDYLGRTFNDTSIGFLGFGRIGKALFRKLPSYTKSIYIYDECVSSIDPLRDVISSKPNVFLCSSIGELFHKSDSVVIAVTDDPSRNTNLITSKQLNLSCMHSIINISRDYVVDINHIAQALLSSSLNCYYSDFIRTDFSVDRETLYKLHSSGRMLSLPHMGGCTTFSWVQSINSLLDLFFTSAP
tara:strand:- start:3046 stop:4002 length:957 start_codon:yes stop_codon:yes gene_type:complete